MEVEEIFDEAFCEVTKKLVKLELQKISEESEKEKEGEALLSEGYRGLIETYGYMNAKITCRFSDELFRYITDTMNSGVTPAEDEIALYLNEYMNIICGYAISKVNNLTGRSSRLSIPYFYQGKEDIGDKGIVQAGTYLAYRTNLGKLHIFMMYSFKSEEEVI